MSYTGKITLVSEDGEGFDAWVQNGILQFGTDDVPFLLMQYPHEGHHWGLIEHTPQASPAQIGDE